MLGMLACLFPQPRPDGRPTCFHSHTEHKHRHVPSLFLWTHEEKWRKGLCVAEEESWLFGDAAGWTSYMEAEPSSLSSSLYKSSSSSWLSPPSTERNTSYTTIQLNSPDIQWWQMHLKVYFYKVKSSKQPFHWHKCGHFP